MQKFRDVLSRWERGDLSMLEAGELLGMSQRQFRRYRDRYEEDGVDGLLDRRLGKPSPKRVSLTASFARPICRITIAGSPSHPRSRGTRLCRPTRHFSPRPCASRRNGSSPVTTPSRMAAAGCR
jgi:hypothetical protein